MVRAGGGSAADPARSLRARVRLAGSVLLALAGTLLPAASARAQMVQGLAVPDIAGYVRGGSSIGEPYSIEAHPMPGWRFDHWTGDITGTTNPAPYGPIGDLVGTTVSATAYFVPVPQTAVIARQTFEPSDTDWTDWTLTGNWAAIPDATTKPGIPTDPSPYGPGALVFDKNGDYGTFEAGSVITAPIDCRGYTGVALTFLHSLTVDDAPLDRAKVEVCSDGQTWTPVYANPSQEDSDLPGLWWPQLGDPSWAQVSYDISAVADGQPAVRVRFTFASDGTTPPSHGGGALHGWAIDDVTLSGAGPDAAFSYTPSGLSSPAGLASYGPYPALDSMLWQIGPALAGGGQVRDADGDPATPETELVGADPGTNAAGDPGGTVLGTALGGNYPAGMAAAGPHLGPEYLQWGPFDLHGLQQTGLAFQRWLEVGSGTLDRASVQVHVATPKPAGDTLGALEPELAAESAAPVTLSAALPKQAFPLSAGEHYHPLAVVITYNTQGFTADGAEMLRLQYSLRGSATNPAWVTFAGGSITTNSYDPTCEDEGAQTVAFADDAFATQADYIGAQDDADFAVRAILSHGDGTALDPSSPATAVISDVKVAGVLWRYVWDNRQESPHAEILDRAWTPVSYDLSRFGADDCRNVWVRWSLGPTDSGFSTEYGGWNLDQLEIRSASNRWSPVTVTAPKALVWGETGEVSITLRNDGTATWDAGDGISEAQGEYSLLAADRRVDHYPLGDSIASGRIGSAAPGDPLSQPISRWGAGRLALPGPVAPGAMTRVTTQITAPPLTSLWWGFHDGWNPAAPELDALDCDWALDLGTAQSDTAFLPTLLNTHMASASIFTGRFTDDGVNADGTPYWARYYIEELAGRVPLVVQGYGDGSYRPAQPVTRDQMAVYIARVMDLDYRGHGTGAVFSDVPVDSWAADAIEACAKAGVVSGYPDRTYHPTAVVTREQMAKFVTLAAGFPLQGAPGSDDPGWFHDVIVELPKDWKPGDPDPRNPYRDYIATLKAFYVVQGYADRLPDGTAIVTYRPTQPVTRDQLAVYLWRAFLQSGGHAIVLGGPGITRAPIATGAAPYYGYADAGTPFIDGPFPSVDCYQSRLVRTNQPVYAYVTLDTSILPTDGSPLAVDFSLMPLGRADSHPISHTEAVPYVTLYAWYDAVWGTDLHPYRNVVWAIPTGLQGDYQLKVSVAGSLLARQPYLSVLAPMYAERFEDYPALGAWASFGQPSTPGPGVYPLSHQMSDPTFRPNRDFYNGAGSLELQQTQQVVRVFPTPGRHNLHLGLKYCQDGNLRANESLAVDWSPDYGANPSGATWRNLATVKGDAVPRRLPDDPIAFLLPNGDPNGDPPVIGADDDPGFALRLSCSASSEGRVYFDDVEISGT